MGVDLSHAWAGCKSLMQRGRTAYADGNRGQVGTPLSRSAVLVSGGSMSENQKSFWESETDRWSRRRFLKATAGATAAAVAGPALAACGGSSSEGGQAAKIGILADMSGPLAVFGRSYWNTARLAAEDVNKTGGVLGKKVTLTLEDSASDNTVAVQKAGQLVQEKKVDVVIGGLTSSMREAIK